MTSERSADGTVPADPSAGGPHAPSEAAADAGGARAAVRPRRGRHLTVAERLERAEGADQVEHVEHVDAAAVEAVVRAQLARALGGRRGMVEAAVPTITFTFTYILSKDVRLAITLSLVLASTLLVVRLVQRQTVQFVVNALVGIGVGCFFVWLGGRGGADASQQALAYFLPGLLYNTAYAVVMTVSILTRWPVVGFMVGAVADDPLEWRRDPQIVRLCSHLTWVLVVPCVARVVVQAPIYLAGRSADDADPFVTALGLSRVAMGWPLQLSALAIMVWMLARNRTPVSGRG